MGIWEILKRAWAYIRNPEGRAVKTVRDPWEIEAGEILRDKIREEKPGSRIVRESYACSSPMVTLRRRDMNQQERSSHYGNEDRIERTILVEAEIVCKNSQKEVVVLHCRLLQHQNGRWISCMAMLDIKGLPPLEKTVVTVTPNPHKKSPNSKGGDTDQAPVVVDQSVKH